MFKQGQELTAGLLTLFTGDSVMPVPLDRDIATILNCAAALPLGSYDILTADQDDEVDHLPTRGTLIACWSGSPGTSGYGSVEQVPGGLLIYHAGSEGAGAGSTWILRQ